MALAAYRALIRSSRIAFQGDAPLLTAALTESRLGFELNREIADPTAAEELVAHARQIADVLRTNVIQGKRKGEEEFELRIHEHIERGDNESIKLAGMKGAGLGGGCCGGSGGKK
ncbi:hypothetical protein EDC01DRAFT_790728 [Geopyxis carbonaria]|nr:hypothetical protein EDC01DRAFT_790728 [Geopyxis carbonaria]